MINRLRRKFVAIALASMALVLLVIVGGINIANYISITAQEDARADLVVLANGRLSESGWDAIGDPGAPRDPDSPDGSPRFDPGEARRDLGEEAPFDTRYFIVWIDDDDDDDGAEVDGADDAADTDDDEIEVEADGAAYAVGPAQLWSDGIAYADELPEAESDDAEAGEEGGLDDADGTEADAEGTEAEPADNDEGADAGDTDSPDSPDDGDEPDGVDDDPDGDPDDAPAADGSGDGAAAGGVGAKATAADLSHIASIDAPRALALGEQAWKTGLERGSLAGYRFLRCMIDGEDAIVFVDASRGLSSFASFALASVVASIIGLLAVAAILVPVSAIVVRPLEESQERQRRFVTNASHELKTPLAIISSSADVIEIENGASEWVDSIRHQVGRLSDLTSKLVILTKAEEGTATMQVDDLNLTALAEEAVREFGPVAVASGKKLVSRISPATTARGDKALVAQVISLLLDNALKHSNEGGEVRLEAEARRGHARIGVWNTVEGIAPGDHPELFDRFYRADEARPSSGGHGIGLAVVSAIAEAHNGSVSAHSADGASLEIVVNL